MHLVCWSLSKYWFAGNYGGLALFWDCHKISPLWWISSHYSIYMVATALDSGETILVTNVYAPIDIHEKIHLWDHIRYVHSLYSLFSLDVRR